MDLPAEYDVAMGAALRATYFRGWAPDYLASAAGEADLAQHVRGRMVEAAEVVVPWVADALSLSGARVVEIGCGTGSSTASFAARAASVQAFDIDGPSLAAARERVTLLKQRNVEFHQLPGDWTRNSSSLKEVALIAHGCDIVLLEALLEHLTIDERFRVLKLAFEALRPGGAIVIYETPNRLQGFDWHSFLLPFFDALPDDLARAYASRTPRAHFRIADGDNEWHESLYRLGRGVSYHEFEIALGNDAFCVIEDGFSPRLHRRDALSDPFHEFGVARGLAKHLPTLPLAFVRPSLDLIICKQSNDEVLAARLATRARRHLERRVIRESVEVFRESVATYRESVAVLMRPWRFLRRSR